MKHFRYLAAACLLGVPVVASATAGGGVTSGAHTFVDGFSNYQLEATSMGGFGYGSSSRGTRVGGFGLSISDQAEPEDLVGGFGGVIASQELQLGLFTIAITSWTVVVGIRARGVPGTGGYFALFEEVALEVGVAALPWIQLVGYAGFQVVGSVLPGVLISETLSYTPSIGLRVVWGSFR